MRDDDRRAFLLGAAGAGVLLAACTKSPAARADAPARAEEGEAEVTPAEDLMREHGVLERILLVYDESARRLERAEALPDGVLAEAADLVRRFVEQYHEKLEEDFLFPKLEAANVQVQLVATLRAQHAAGRRITDAILALAPAAKEDPRRTQLVHALRSFERMYRPHAAREDTVLVPAFGELLPAKELHELGERFEEKEHALFGERGFHGIVDQVASFEQALGIHDLAQFTPKT